MPGMNMMNNPHPDDQEAAMARADLYKMANYSFKLFKMIRDGDQLEGWVQAKITKAADYVASVYHYMEYEMKFSEYGSKLENSDMYTEDVRKQFQEKLNEAKSKLEKLKKKNKEDLEEGFPTVADAKDRAEKEKTTGKFDKKEIKPGVTQYTRKSSTFSDGGDEKDVKKAKKTGKVKEQFKAGMPVPQDIDGASATPSPKKSTTKSTAKPGAKPALGTIKNGVWTATPPKPGEKGVPAPSALPEGKKPDFLDMDKDGNKKEPMKKAIADKKKNPFAKVKEAEEKCNHTAKGKSCPVHGLKECGSMYEGDKFDPLKHVKNPTKGEKTAAKDVKRGSYADRAAMLKSTEADGRLKK